ncbi:tripartite tricarboxylate transporter substrate-binding protein [Chloroflexota bacterium]
MVHNPPGGGYDTFTRGIAKIMAKYLDVPMVVRNITGGGGATGTTWLYRSDPDGYTMGIVDLEKRIGQGLVIDLEYEMGEFTYIGQLVKESVTFIVDADSPWYTLEDLRAAGQVKPLRFGSVEPGPTAIIPFSEMEIPFTIVSGYPSSADCCVALSIGEVDVMEYPVSTLLDWIENGELRAIFVCADEPDPLLTKIGVTDVPLITEWGYPELAALGSIRALIGPPGMPEEIRSVLEDAFLKSLDDPELLAWAEAVNRPCVPGGDGESAYEAYEVIKELYSRNQEMLALYWED